MKGVIAMILAGGQGDRLSVLSEERAKPAVPFGGRYRIIDFTLSNCANSEIRNVGVLTQYRPRSLNDHIGIGGPWDLDRGGGGVALLQPYIGHQASDWYQGTADAVYQNLYYVEESRAELVLILAGDHVYKMAYDELIDIHRSTGADVTIPVCTVPMDEAHRFGTVVLDDDDRVVAFEEKPEQPRSDLISMGIYLFRKDALMASLVDATNIATGERDFGRDVLPALVADPAKQVFAYRFNDYWRDVGTIESYFRSNMDLLEDLPPLNLYDGESEIRTPIVPKPPVKIGPRAEISRSLLSVGSIINGRVEHSVLSPGVYVEEGAVVRDSIIFDDTRIASGAVIDRSIVDKAVQVGKACHIGYGDDWTENQERGDIVNAGFTIVGKRAELLANTRVGRNCVIGPAVIASGGEQHYIPSGATIRTQHGDGVFSV